MESEAGPGAPDALMTALVEVHEHYRRQVEAAIRAGRPHPVVDGLAQQHADEALGCITTWPATGVDTAAAHPSGRRDDGPSTASPFQTARTRRGIRPCQP